MTSSGKILAGDCHGKLFQHADDACVIFEMNQEVARLEIFQKAQPAAHAFLSRPKRSERRETQASAPGFADERKALHARLRGHERVG
jgi:hypothetical protein